MNHGYIFAVLSFERFLAPSMSLCLALSRRHKQNIMGAKKKFMELLLDFHRPFLFSLPNMNRHNAMATITPFSLTLSVYIDSVSFFLATHLYPHLCPYHPHNIYALRANYISSAGLACLEFHFLELNKISLKIFAVTLSN